MALTFYEDLPTNQKVAVFDLKEFLVNTGGWVVLSSSDGTTYNSSGDEITHGSTGAGGLDNASAWFRMRDPDAEYEVTVQRGTGGAPNNFRVKWTRATFNAGSPGAIRTPTTADADDEYVLLGSGTDASPSFSALVGGTAGATRVKACVDDANGDFYFAGFPDGGGTPNTSFFIEHPLQSDADDLFPIVAYLPSANHLANSSMTNTVTSGLASWQPDGEGAPVIISTLQQKNASNVVAPNGKAADPITGDHGVVAVPFGRPSTLGNGPCWKGLSRFMKFNGVTGSATGDTYTLNATRDRLVVRDFNFDWDGSVPTNGAASTDRSASELEDLVAGYSLATLGSTASAVIYKMRALADPGPGYVTWITVGEADFAGADAPAAIQAGTAAVMATWTS